MALSLDAANLAAIWLETLFYGIYVVLFSYTCIILLQPRPYSRRNAKNWVLLAMCFALLFFSTFHMAVSLRMLLEAFVFDITMPGGAKAYFLDEGMLLSVLRKGIFAVSVLVADSLMIFRCYVLWERNTFIIIFPVLTLCATIIADCFIAKQLINFHPSFATSIFTPTLNAWVPAYFSLTFVTTLYLSGAIAWKLWRAYKKATDEQLQFTRMFATIIFVESNFLYPLTNIIALICFAAKSNTQVISVNVLAQIIAIAPTLMILQVQMGLYSLQPDFHLVSAGQSPDASRAEVIGFTDFTRPYAFMCEPGTPGAYFPPVPRKNPAMKKPKAPKRPPLVKGDGSVSYTKYDGSFGIIPFDLIIPRPTSAGSSDFFPDQGIVVTSTVDVYDARQAS